MFKKEDEYTAPEVLTDEPLELVSGGNDPLGVATVGALILHGPISGPIGPERPVVPVNVPPVRGLSPL